MLDYYWNQFAYFTTVETREEHCQRPYSQQPVSRYRDLSVTHGDRYGDAHVTHMVTDWSHTQ